MNRIRAAAASALLVAPLLAALPVHAQEARVIVKFREGSSAMRQALAANRASSLSARTGLALTHRSEPAPGMQALLAHGITSDALAARLAQEPEVEFAVPDRLRKARALPNDPRYPEQWYLQSVEAAAIHADAAWDITTGAASVVVAVIDSGIRPEHPDLGARLLPGFDFISNAALSGDGDGRDSDPSDPGDYVSAADRSNPAFQDVCPDATEQSSSWHGTEVTGVLAAATNNSTGVAGTTWSGSVLPVRALGKCGGFDSDIVAAMRWAAGLSVPGVPTNPTPARILNLSLGGSGECSSAYRDVIPQLTAAKVLVVAAAGNETGAVEAPANCSGVLAVAGVRHNGAKVGYSSFGSEVGISAPAGNCVTTFLPCQFPIATTSNAGATTPGASIYTDGNRPALGTSFSAPMASGVAALMLASNPSLTPDQIVTRIKQSARAFPTDPTLPECPETATGPDNLGQCNCTTGTCGAGLLDAAAALVLAAPPSAAISAPAAPVAGTTITLDAGASTAADGRRVVAWQWRLVSAPAGAALTSPSEITTALQAPTEGTYVVQLTVTDDKGASDDAVLSLQVAAPASDSPAPPSTGDDSAGSNSGSGGGGGGGGAADPWTVLIFLAALPGTILGRKRRSRTRCEGGADSRSDRGAAGPIVPASRSGGT